MVSGLSRLSQMFSSCLSGYRRPRSPLVILVFLLCTGMWLDDLKKWTNASMILQGWWILFDYLHILTDYMVELSVASLSKHLSVASLSKSVQWSKHKGNFVLAKLLYSLMVEINRWIGLACLMLSLSLW